MKITHAPSFRRTRSASACGLLLAGVTVAHAQGAAPAPTSAASAADRSDTQTVTVTGIRASLDSSMALKRDAHGVVDGITAEDVGKFPDTNLAESMQRISGVSIDRSANEGSKITVRGFGPDYNMILLNGRQMPTSTIWPPGRPPPRVRLRQPGVGIDLVAGSVEDRQGLAARGRHRRHHQHQDGASAGEARAAWPASA